MFFDAQALRSAVDLPMLGVVTLVKNEEVRRREARSLRRFLLALGALVVVFVAGMVALSYLPGLGR